MIFCKKGLTSNFLGIILAVIGIAGLAFLGVKIYNSFVGLEEQNAQAFINDLEGKINTLRDGENNTFFMRGVDKWFLVAYNRDEKTPMGEDISRPEKCFLNDFCLCICEGSPKVEDCQEHGFCRNIDRPVNMTRTIRYYDSSVFKTYENFMKCVPFYENNLNALFVSKQSSIFINSTLLDLNTVEDKNFYFSLNSLNPETYPCTRIIIQDNDLSNPGSSGPPGG